MTVLALFDNPMTAVVGCLVWVPVGVWVLSLIGWSVQGEIEPFFGLFGAALALGLGFATTYAPDPVISPFLFLALLGSVIMFPFLRSAVQKRALVAIDVEQLEGAFDMLQFKPDNVSARMRFAEILYRRGLPGHAIAIAGEVLPGMPPSIFRSEHQMVALWRQMAADPAYHRPVPCPKCGAKSALNQITCEKCKAPHLVMYAKGAWLGGMSARKLLAGWAVGLLLLVAIPFTARQPELSQATALGAIGLELAVGGFIVARYFFGVGGEA